MKKKILAYIEDPRFGGPHQFTINLFDQLKEEFDFSFLISNKENNFFLKKIKKNKIKFYIMPISILSLNLNYILRYIFFFIPEILELKKFIKKKKF